MRKIFYLLRNRFRQKRYIQIQNLVDSESVVGFILDLGGGPASFFAELFPRPKQVVLIDIDYRIALKAKAKKPELHVIVADGEHLPFADCSIHMTVCNSVIEHVEYPVKLAAEINRVSQSYFLQTPNAHFPLETHSFIAIPFYRLLPWEWLRRFMCRLFKANFEYVNSVRYLPEKSLRILFPRATITYEKAFGLKKSFYVSYLNRDSL